ncbi:MAG TPA: hypothetical protein VF628_02360 [Allosphingosinicella sp.]|jgi:hypothetical protein
MSLLNCIPGLVEAGKMKPEQAARMEAMYRRHYAHLSRGMSPEAAAAEASEAALREWEHAARLKKRQTLLQVKRQMAIGDEIKAGDRHKTPVRIVERVDYQTRRIIGQAHGKIEGVLDRHSRNLLGEARDKSGLNDIVRELFGTKTDNASAREFAGAWRDAAEMLRQRFNRAGGAIGKRGDWGLPQSHDMLKVRAAGFDAWRAEVAPRLDLERMIDEQSGLPFNPGSLELALREVWESIRSDGWNKRSPGAGGIGKLASRRADHRFLVFKSADDWLAYQEKFGTGNPFDAMMGHVEGMARDIALMEVMGPNPAATLKWMQDGVKQAAALDRSPGEEGLSLARGTEHKLGQLFDVVSGNLNSPVNGKWARRMGGTRAVLTSAFLGSAALSAITDVGFQAVSRAYAGLPVTGAITGYLKLLNPLNAEDRRVAVRLGLIAEEASKMAASLNRFIDGTHGPEVARRLSDAVLRASGLSAWTQAGRWAFGMEFLGHLADQRGKSLGELDGALRRTLERYGIDHGAWDAIRATETYKHGGAEFLRPDDVADEAHGDALMRMVLQETDYAVPASTARGRAALSFGQRPGTWGGEIIRNGALFKSFGVSVVLMHGARMMGEKGWNRAAYFAGLTVTTTLLGGVAMQLKEISKGRDPKPMTNASFWGRAVLQGGGYGIFGDFLNGATNEFDGGPAETLAGPVVGTAGDLIRSGKRLVGDALDPDKEANPGREAAKLAKRYVPGGSLWYARLAYDRLAIDLMSEWTDPDYATAWSRMEERAEQQGQEMWWRPGDDGPDRGPDFANAWEGELPE